MVGALSSAGTIFWFCLVLLLHFAVPTTAFKPSKIYQLPQNCNKVCSFDEANNLINGTRRSLLKNREIVSVDVTSGHCDKVKYYSWSNSARQFMKYLNIFDSAFGCPQERIVKHPSLAQKDFMIHLSTALRVRNGIQMVEFNYSLSTNEHVVREPGNVPGQCFITTNRGIISKVSKSRISTDWILSEIHWGEPAFLNAGFVFVLLNNETLKLRSVRVPHDSNDTCIGKQCDSSKLLWLPLTTFNTTVEEESMRSKFAVYSMFAKFNIEQVPGMSGLLENLKEGVRLMENVNNDLSWSNLAILCLPLVMAIPPVSLLETVSNKVTVWYAFATDFLAALPLMIKGIELILVYRQATPSMYSTLSMVGKRHGIFETWYSRCQPPPGILGWAGTMMVVASVWFVLASSYVEFLFWRLAQYKQGVMKKTDDEERLAITEELPSSMMERDIREQLNNRNRLTAHSAALIFFSMSFFSAMILMFLVQVMPTAHLAISERVAIDVVVSLLFAILRGFIMNRQSQFLSWRFVGGFILGCIGGPIYMFLNVFRKERNSNNWTDVSDGASVGFAGMVMVLKFWLKPELDKDDPSRRYITGSLVFVSVLIISSVIAHVFRCSGKDRMLWWYTGNGFTLGLLLGPFSIFLRNCFPIPHVEKEKARRYFLLGMYFGMTFICMVIANAARFAYNIIQGQERMSVYEPSFWR